MLKLEQINKLMQDLVRFEERVGRKIPDGIWNRSLNILLKDGSQDVIHTVELLQNGNKVYLQMSSSEIFDMIGRLFHFHYEYIHEAAGLNAIDRYFLRITGFLFDNRHMDTAEHYIEPGKEHRAELSAEPWPPELENASGYEQCFLYDYCRDLFEKYKETAVICEQKQGADTDTDTGTEKLQCKFFKTVDDYQLNYYVHGNEQLPVLVLCNAYGMSRDIWRYTIDYFAGSYRLIIWETRGTLPEHVGMPLNGYLQAEDLCVILEMEGVQTADFICWCSGFKTAAEFYRTHSGKVRSLTAICGYFNPIGDGKAIWTEFDKTIGKLSSMLAGDAKLTGNPFVLQLIKKLFSFNLTGNSFEKRGVEVPDKLLSNLIGSADVEVKAIITAPFAGRETLLSYARLTLELQNQDVSDVLDLLECPVLLIHAGLDIIADIRTAEFASSRIKKCRVEYLPHATHWCLWEDHAEVNEIIENFLHNVHRL
jgi:pimeloyl-ACP methyl ester carboxylesterase